MAKIQTLPPGTQMVSFSLLSSTFIIFSLKSTPIVGDMSSNSFCVKRRSILNRWSNVELLLAPLDEAISLFLFGLLKEREKKEEEEERKKMKNWNFFGKKTKKQKTKK